MGLQRVRRPIRLLTALAVLAALAGPATLLVSPQAAQASQGFNDDNGSVHEQAIEAVASAGITSGCNPPLATNFCPTRAVTRGEMAAFLVRALGLSQQDPAYDFTDDNGSTFEADIEKLATAGITRGCNPPANTRFCPTQRVTRGQMAAFLVRALGLTASDPGIDFADDDASTFEADIEKLATAGITRGCNPPANTKFCPENSVTRAQMASFLVRALDLPLSPEPGFAVDDNDKALVARYHVIRKDDGVDVIYTNNMRYWPRSMAKGLDIEPDPDYADKVDSPGRYTGWDVLSPSTRWEFKNIGPRNDWMNFTLNRPARVAVVWRDDFPLPGWLSGWDEGGSVAIDGDLHPVYEKDYPAGPVKLGTVEYSSEWREMYLILLAEADGRPTPAPPAPAGFSPAKPNVPCPAWVHGLHTTTGPDGARYETWHPQIDPVYWCYFGHEHGSNPALIPGSPMIPYQYVASNVPQDEPNMGFKEFIFKDMSGNHWVRFVIHAGTASDRRICAQFHTLYVSIYDLAGNEKFAAGFKADYGAAFSTGDTGNQVLLPTDCGYSMPGLADQVDNQQRRRINVGSGANNYETWDSREETSQVLNLGMVQFDHAFDIRNPMSHCVDRTCNSVVVRDPERQNATRRTIQMASWRADFEFDADHALGSGEYYTDAYANGLLDPGNSLATRQFVEPGFHLEFKKNATADRIDCSAQDPWLFAYTCYQIGGAGNREHLPHIPDMNLEYSLWRN
ncbi:MAG: S-layer homology domain-containing protein [Acidimicrobiia bacterium]|nr:S-layer homology domain-containing protein [Acidimicrobiia bacterium]